MTFQTGFTKWAEGSVLAQFGDTHVLCNVTIEDTLPPWLRHKDESHGWLTAEYAMLPRSAHSRSRREQRWPKGRTQEISRLIGRSLRMALDLKLLGERTLTVDCDVLQADGGTRTAAVTGSWIAVALALQPLIEKGRLPPEVMQSQIAAISVGLVDGVALLDLAYEEDVRAEVDFNVVMAGNNQLVEVQGTAEKAPFDRRQLDTLVDLAAQGIAQLQEMQKSVISKQ
ncbi:MAG: ribonuclease PH [Chloroflexi bacterium]|nr:ribonuclease PH [Chloroflexota bacterium]